MSSLKKNPKSLLSALPDLLGGPEGVKEFQKVVRQKQIVRKLLSARLAANLTQADIAARMGMTQSRISKIENGFDDDLTLGNLHAYLSALGTDLRIMTHPKGMKAAEAVKFHIHHANEAMKQVVSLAHKDEKIAEGAASLMFQVFTVFNEWLIQNSKLLPKDCNGNSYVVIEEGNPAAQEADSAEAPIATKKPRPRKPRQPQHA
jgi:transcriptional regulator with XRE-family HTH domain